MPYPTPIEWIAGMTLVLLSMGITVFVSQWAYERGIGR